MVLLCAATGMAWAQASAPAIPFREAVGGDTPEPQQWIVALLSCGVLLVALLYLLRRFGSHLPRGIRASSQRLKVVERTSVTHGVQLVVVEYGQRHLLLSISAAGTVCLRDDAVELPVLGGER
jgi:flagellar biogenesis protein FliO